MADIEMKLSIKELRGLLMATTVHLNIKTRKLVDAESSGAYTPEAIKTISKETEALIALNKKVLSTYQQALTTKSE